LRGAAALFFVVDEWVAAAWGHVVVYERISWVMSVSAGL